MKTNQMMPYTCAQKKKTALKSNDTVLNDLPGELYSIEGHDKIPHNCKYLLATI